MTDREYLELAAKAAGIDVRWYQGDCLRVADKCNGFAGKWNPLTDDGDALRLAVKTGLAVSICAGYTAILDCKTREEHGDDPLAATRRAIVRAAASALAVMRTAMPARARTARQGLPVEDSDD